MIASGYFRLRLEQNISEYGCAKLVGSDWSFFKPNGVRPWSKIKMFSFWEQNYIEDPNGFMRQVHNLDLISLPTGSPAIAYSFYNAPEQMCYLKYARLRSGDFEARVRQILKGTRF